MKVLKPGDACPCCGEPLKEGDPTETILLLSWIAGGMSLLEAGRNYKINKENVHAE